MDKFDKVMALGVVSSIIGVILFYGFIAWVIVRVLQFYGVI